MYDTMCMTQNMGVIFFENGGVWHKMYDTKIATPPYFQMKIGMEHKRKRGYKMQCAMKVFGTFYSV